MIISCINCPHWSVVLLKTKEGIQCGLCNYKYPVIERIIIDECYYKIKVDKVLK